MAPADGDGDWPVGETAVEVVPRDECVERFFDLDRAGCDPLDRPSPGLVRVEKPMKARISGTAKRDHDLAQRRRP